MAKPRVFISSTYYDLKYIRASLELFVESLGFEAVLSERGNVPYDSEAPLDESCYREILNADIFVLIVGGRYGSPASTQGKGSVEADGWYESITRKEFTNAIEQNIPVYILVEKPVYFEHRTYLSNKGDDKVHYAHVDSPNTYRFIDEILSLKQNNPVHPFEKAADIELWLRDQWAGMFKELIRRRSDQKRISSLASEVTRLSELNETLKNYLEEIMAKVLTPVVSSQLIKKENKRLNDEELARRIATNGILEYIKTHGGFNAAEALEIIRRASDLVDLFRILNRDRRMEHKSLAKLQRILHSIPEAQMDLNTLRECLDQPPFDYSGASDIQNKGDITG